MSLILAAGALASLIPLGLVPAPDEVVPTSVPRFWGALALAVAGPIAWAVAQHSQGWLTGLGPALWLAIAATTVMFALLSAVDRRVRRLAPMLCGYLVVLGLIAIIWQQMPGRPLRNSSFPAWLLVHVAVALVSYGLLTLAAVAAGAVVLQERALRRKRPTGFTRSLPSVADGERILTRLLTLVQALLGLALASGAVINRTGGGPWFDLDHKTVLSGLAFGVIGVILLMHSRFGISGRRGARYGLLAYLLLTLAYPGVKFVTDVVMGGAAPA